MNEEIETRQLITLDILGSVVRGTYHKPLEAVYGPPPSAIGQQRVAVLILNSLSPTRAAAGDSAVYWAESFAKVGYPSFRLDMPGFGDSDGNPPPELLKFINTGGYGPLASAMIAQLAPRFDLSGVVVVGLCAGAVSALYTASISKLCCGLVLMDPYFHLPIPDSPLLWQKLTGRISRTPAGRGIHNVYDRLKEAGRSLRRNRMPKNTNFALLSCWKTVASTGLPILLFKAPSITQRGEEFDYLKYILEHSGGKGRVDLRIIDGAGHTFSNRVGQSAVRHDTEKWLTSRFPLHSQALNSQEEFDPMTAVSQSPSSTEPKLQLST